MSRRSSAIAVQNEPVLVSRTGTTILDVHLLFQADHKILLGKRQNTGYADGQFHLPAGHLEEDESVVAAAIREAKEELGVIIMPKDLELVYTLHQRSNVGRLGLFFRVHRWTGTLENREPEKCGGLFWFEFSQLPREMVSYARDALINYRAGERFGLRGW